jgi:hypothetical protein
VLHITPEQLNWLGQRPHQSGYVVADKTPYGVHGICQHSWHRTREAAARELNRQYRQGNSTQTIYKIVSTVSQPYGLGGAPAKRRCKRLKRGASGLKRCANYGAAAEPIYTVTWAEEGEAVPMDVPEDAGAQQAILESELADTLTPFDWPHKVNYKTTLLEAEEDDEGWVVPIFQIDLEVYAGDPNRILRALRGAGYGGVMFPLSYSPKLPRGGFAGAAQEELDRIYEAVDNWERMGDTHMKLVASQVEALLLNAEDDGLKADAQIEFLRETLFDSLSEMARVDEEWASRLYHGDPRMLNDLINDLFAEAGLEW